MAGAQVSIGGDASGAIRAMGTVEDKAARLAQKIKEGFTTRIGQRMFDGLIQAANALPNAMKAAIDAGGRLSDQMARTGAAGEGLVVMERWLTNAGLAADKTTTLLGLMQKGLAGLNEDSKPTAEAFATLGLNMAALRAQDPVAAFQSIGAAIMRIEDPAQRTALSMRIFGRSGAEALVAFADTRGMDTARAQLGQMPSILAANASQLDEVSDRLGNLGTGWQQIGAAAAVAVLPALESITAKIASMDLTAIGAAIGSLINGIVAIGPALVVAGAGLVALKIGAFITSMAAKTREWWANTAAIQANTQALSRNASAGASAGSGPKPGAGGRGMAMAAGGILAVAGIGAQLAMSYADDLAASNAVMAEASERGNAAMRKFEINAMRAQVASREEIEKTVAAIEEEKKAIEAAAEAQMKNVDDADTREGILTATVATTKALDLKARQLRATGDEQLAANAATRAAAQAEADLAEKIEKAAEAYRNARESYTKSVSDKEDTPETSGPLSNQLAELDRAEKAIRGKMTKGYGYQDKSAAQILDPAFFDKRADSPEKTRDFDLARKLAAIEEKRVEISNQLRQSKQDAVADYRTELDLLTATIAGEKERVADLKRQAAIKEEIARLTAAGFSAKDPSTQAAAERIVDARAKADAAQRAAQARQEAAGVLADAEAAVRGPEAMDARTREKRAEEIAAQSGIGMGEARKMASNEADLEKINSLRSKMDGMSFQSSLGAVSSMQAIGGGGGAAASGFDYAREQTELQRQMVEALRDMKTRNTPPTLEV